MDQRLTDPHLAIEQALSVLTGLTMWSAGPPGDPPQFQFGPLRMVPGHEGRPRDAGRYALEVRGPWRLATREGLVLAGDTTFGAPNQASGESAAAATANSLANGAPRPEGHQPPPGTQPTVQRIVADAAGRLRFELSAGLTLEVHPCADGESWRLLEPGEPLPHLVYYDGRLTRE